MTAQERLFKHMCIFLSWENWREGRRVFSSYLDIDTTKDQCRLLNTTPLDCIAGYTMEDAVGDRDLKRMPQINLNFIDGFISRYCAIINSPKRLEHTRQENKLASVLCDLESDSMRENEDNKKISMEADENISQKYEEKQVREKKDRLRGIESCEYLDCYVLTFGMDHINNLKVKDIWVLLRYHFGLKRLKGIPKKVELLEAVDYPFQMDWGGPMQRVGGGWW